MANELREFLSTLKEKLNIIDVAGSYLTLDRRGATYWACCPFHHEKTPSFALNESDQYYHCFGCGESGDVVKLVQNMENVEFMDAVKILAERANLPMPKTNFDNQQTVEAKRKKDAVLKILNETAHFYLNTLNSGKADKFIDYILLRKIPSNMVRKFGLGASLNFTDLPRYLLDKGFSRADMLESGVVSEANGRLIDTQADRLIFPIINAMDEVIAFGGRKVEKVDFGKYKNTRDTIVFNKSKSLYNINLLKKLKKEQTISNVIFVEGYMDALSLYQAGFTNVVASMGTSLTQDQARLIKRYTDNILSSYDGDGAGQKANLRGLDIFKNNGLNVKVVLLPDGLDPDDVIKQMGAEEYRKRCENAVPLIDYKLRVAQSGFDLNKPDDKRKYVSEAIKIIKTADSAAEQEDLLKQLRSISGITFEALKRDLNTQPEIQSQKPITVERKDNSTMYDKASRFVIASYLFGARYTVDEDLSAIKFLNGVHRIIAKYIITQNTLEEKVRPGELLEFFEDGSQEFSELSRVLDYSEGDQLKGEVAAKFFFDCLKTLRLAEIKSRIADLKGRIELESDVEIRKNLAATLQSLIIQEKKIKSGERK